MKYLITIVSLLFCLAVFSQGPPPSAAVADSSKMPLILEVVESCHYEIYFEHFKDSVVQQFGDEHGWSSTKIETVKSELTYTPPTPYSYYNAYASVSEVELEKIKAYNASLSENQLKNLESLHNKMIVHNMINALKWKCKGYED